MLGQVEHEHHNQQLLQKKKSQRKSSLRGVGQAIAHQPQLEGLAVGVAPLRQVTHSAQSSKMRLKREMA